MPDFASMTLAEFLDHAASDAPVPGGGGIAALAGALGASMAAMAAAFTAGRPKFAEHDALMRETLDALKRDISGLLAAVDGDAAAFSGIAAAYKLPKGTDDEKAARKAAVDAALAASMRVPLEMIRRCLAAAEPGRRGGGAGECSREHEIPRHARGARRGGGGEERRRAHR